MIANTSTAGVVNAGIRTLSTLAGATGIIKVTVTRVTSQYGNIGFRLEGNSFGTVSSSTASNNTRIGFLVFPASIGGAGMNIVDSTAHSNGQEGVFALGTGQTGIARIFNLTAFDNAGNQLRIDPGGQILSNGRNHIGTPTEAPGAFADQ